MCDPYISVEAGRPCPLPVMPENVIPIDGQFMMGDSIMLACKEGFVSTEPLSITCQDDLTWSLPLGVCQSKYSTLSLHRLLFRCL